MILRPYQEELIEKARHALRGNQSVLMQAPTGAGKTALTVTMMKNAASQGKRSFFCVHQNELLQQTGKALWKQHLEHGVVAAGKRASKLPAQVASVQTLVRRLDQYQEPDLIIIDEAHRAAASTYLKILEAYPSAKVVGLTATPQRTDGKGLADIFQSLIVGPSVRQLIDAGFLCDYEIFAPPSMFDATGIQTRAGDFAKEQAEAAMDKPTITGDAVNHYRKLAKGKRCVVMCVGIKHADHVAEQYRQSGIPAESLDGTMSNAEREAILDRFERGQTLVLTNTQLLIEGVDIPAIEVVQWLRPTQSLIVWMQGVGRGLRPAPGKDRLLLLDHVGNVHRHGLPDDPREWSLEGRKKGKRKANEEPDVSIQQCQSCYAVFRPGPSVCPKCGAPVQKQSPRELEIIEGELQKIDLERARKERKREQGAARTMRELVALGIRREMRKPGAWAAITTASREGRKPTPAEFQQAKQIEKELRG